MSSSKSQLLAVSNLLLSRYIQYINSTCIRVDLANKSCPLITFFFVCTQKPNQIMSMFTFIWLVWIELIRWWPEIWNNFVISILNLQLIGSYNRNLNYIIYYTLCESDTLRVRGFGEMGMHSVIHWINNFISMQKNNSF